MCCPRCASWSRPLLIHWSLLPTYKFEKNPMSTIFATDSMHRYMLQLHPLIPLHIACICQESTHTGAVTPELVTFGTETHFSHPRPHPIMEMVSHHHLMTSNVTRKLKSLSREKIFQLIGRQNIYPNTCKSLLDEESTKHFTTGIAVVEYVMLVHWFSSFRPLC